MKTIFLSGPMRGINREIAQKWRKEAEERLKSKFKILNPYRGRGEKETFIDPKGAIIRDKNDILSCDILLVNDTFKSASMIGTSMEILFAYERFKQIIVFGKAHYKDYWLDYHATMRVDTLEEACKICEDLLYE